MTYEDMERRRQLADQAEAARKRGDTETFLAKIRQANLIWRRTQGGYPWADRIK